MLSSMNIPFPHFPVEHVFHWDDHHLVAHTTNQHEFYTFTVVGIVFRFGPSPLPSPITALLPYSRGLLLIGLFKPIQLWNEMAMCLRRYYFIILASNLT